MRRHSLRQQTQREPTLCIDPALRRPPAAAFGQVIDIGRTVLVAVLGVNGLTSGKREWHAAPLPMLVAVGDEGEVDAPLNRIEDRSMVECRGSAVAVEKPITMDQDIAIEGSGDPGGIIVGRLQDSDIFNQIGAQ